MITAGIDLAAEPGNTAAAALAWTRGPQVVHLRTDCDDSALRDLFAGGAVKIGIDCPLGWPQDFVEFVRAYAAQQAVGPAATIEQRRPLAYRRTDMRVMGEPHRLRPLSVSADRIAHAAFRCAALLSSIVPALDRSGHGRVVEVYPAGSLRHWQLPHRGYKGRPGEAVRATIVDALAGSIDFGAFRDRCIASDHALDAVVAALAAGAAHRGLATLPSDDDLPIARTEGWIALPTCSLAELAQ